MAERNTNKLKKKVPGMAVVKYEGNRVKHRDEVVPVHM